MAIKLCDYSTSQLLQCDYSKTWLQNIHKTDKIPNTVLCFISKYENKIKDKKKKITAALSLVH